MRKKRVMLVSENHQMATGYATYCKAMLERWHNTGKYEIADFSVGMSKPQAEALKLPWDTYTNTPSPNDPEEVKKQFHNAPHFQHGSWRLDTAIAHFKPDIVISIKDPWADAAFISKSPFLPYFSWAQMPTVDSTPQKQEWIEWFSKADAIYGYSEFGLKELGNAGKHRLNIKETASPAVDERYQMLPAGEIRSQLGIDPDWNIVGTVMRNQIRKLFPELFKAFAIFLKKADKEIANRTYLLIHTSYPERMGWNIPDIISQYGIQGKVLSTYICQRCQKPQILFFSDAMTKCRHCSNFSAVMTGAGKGISVEELIKVYNCMDLYMQYANCLGKNEEVLIRRDNKEQWCPISQVNIGDEAWTHKSRWKNVSKVWKNLNKSKGKEVKMLSVHGDYETLTATENHEFPALTRKELSGTKSKSVREQIGDKLRNKEVLPEFGKYELSQLNKGDMLAYPIDDSIENINKIDLSKEINDKYIVTDDHIKVIGGYKYPRYIEVDNDFCKFMGLFAADGSWQNEKSKKGIKITSHNTELANHAVATDFFTKAKISNVDSVRKYKGREAQDNALWSKLYGEVFEKWFGKNNTKSLPVWVEKLPPEKQKYILQGMFIGDGHYCEKKNYSSYTTISRQLANQLKILLRRLRIPFSTCITDRSTHKNNDSCKRQPVYVFEIYKCNISKGEFTAKRSSTNNVYYNNLHLMKIRSINKSTYGDDVWCLTVDEDHTMTTRLGATFQCEGMGMPQVEAAACGVPIASTDYSAMSDVVRWTKGYPIKVAKMFKDLNVHAERAYPDNEHAAEIMLDFFSRSGEDRHHQRQDVREACFQRYDWDKTAQTWMDYIDNYEPKGLQGKWNSPPKLLSVPSTIPQFPSNQAFIEWLFIDVMQAPERAYDYEATQVLRDLNFGANMSGGLEPIDRQKVFNRYAQQITHNNQLEQVRVGQLQSNVHSFYTKGSNE